MKMNEFDEMQKNGKNEISDDEWEGRLRLTPEQLAEREAAAQILVAQENARLRREEREAEAEREKSEEAEERKRVEKEKKAKKQRLSKEEKRLRESYKELPEDLMRVADGLIRRAAFMRVTLEEYELDLSDKGYVEMFSQSKEAKPYERERPVARLYGTMNKNYQSIIKQLADLIPEKPIIPPEDEFDSFVGGKK